VSGTSRGRRRPRIDSVRTRLVLLFFAITASAIGFDLGAQRGHTAVHAALRDEHGTNPHGVENRFA
jgi:hypothetical protein